jgi:quinol monooxygenase YgiN
MQQPIVYVDTSKVREGKVEQLEASMKHLAAFVEANVPQLISYAFFLDEDRTQMTVVAVHPDSASLEFHMDVGAEEFRKFADLIELVSIEVYGRVSDAVLDRLHQKARMLGNATVAVHEFYTGFSR